MKTVSVRRSLARVGSAALMVVALHSTFAQAPAPPAALQSGVPTATIKVSTRLVTVDVIVQDKKNQPVPGLTKDDFALFEDDQPQTISVFSVEGQAAPNAMPAATLPPGFFSNRPNLQSSAPASATVILLDGLNTTPADMAMARSAVAKFVQKLEPQDRVALCSMGNGLHIVQDFTNDSALLVKSLKNLHSEPTGGSGPQLSSLTAPDPRLDPTGGDTKLATLMNVPTVDATLRSLNMIGEHLAALPGRKTLIWISSGFPLVVKTGPDVGRMADVSDLSPKVRQASQVLSKYNVAVYPMDTRALQTGFNNIDEVSAGTMPGTSAGTMQIGSMLDSDTHTPMVSVARGSNNKSMQDAHDSGRLLAQLTGGRTLYDDNDLTGALRSAVDDSKLVYVLGYYPGQDKWDSKFHTFKVQVKQTGVKLTYRSGYLATLEQQPLIPTDSQTALEKAVLTPLDSSAIGLLVRVQKEGTNRQNLTIDLRVNVNDLALNHDNGRWNGTLEVVIAQLDAGGDLAENAARKHSVQLNLKEDYYRQLSATGLQLLFPFEPNPKAVQLRVVLRSAVSGSVGTVTIPLSAI